MKSDLHIGTRPDGSPLTIPIGAYDYHAQIIGPTGYGKTFFLIRQFQQLIEKTDAAHVFIDPAGDAYHFLKRWCYSRNLDSRLLLIDPGETRLVVGFNPIRPWAGNHGLQAAIGLDILRRALGTDAFATAPLMARWMFNTLYTLIESGLTMHEAPLLLDYGAPEMRQAVTQRLPESDVRRDFEWLDALLGRSSEAQTMRLVNEQLGSSLNRVRQYTRNSYLRPMLATTEHAIDWKQVLDERKIVLVNLQQRNVLAEEDQRMLGMQIVSEITREAFRREQDEEGRVGCYLTVDEFGRFASPELAVILNEGRKYLLRLILAHQSLSQLVDPKNQDWSLFHAVINNARLKVVFGGLGPKDADEIGRTLYGHLGDPDRRKLELHTLAQISHVERVRSYARGVSSTTGSVSSSGGGSGLGRGSGSASSKGEMFGPDLALVGSGENTVFSTAVQQFDGSSWSDSVVESSSTSVVEIDSPMAVPGEPFEQLSSVQFEPLEEQLYRHVRQMIGRPKQEAVIALSKDEPMPFRVAEVDDPKIDPIQARALDLELMHASPHYSEPELIEREIQERHARLLLSTSNAEVVPEGTWEAAAPGRRRTARRAR